MFISSGKNIKSKKILLLLIITTPFLTEYMKIEKKDKNASKNQTTPIYVIPYNLAEMYNKGTPTKNCTML